MFTSKRRARFRVPEQIRADENMVRAIQILAEQGHRSPGQQIIELVEKGIIHVTGCEAKSHEVERSHAVAQIVTQAALPLAPPVTTSPIQSHRERKRA